MLIEALGTQVLKALGYYVILLLLLRFAGKRLAGQSTTFDLIVLITLGVVIQTAMLAPGPMNAAIFVVTVFSAHKLLAWMCTKSEAVRHWVRGKPRALVRDGVVIEDALEHEGISQEELRAGLRKLGHDDIYDIKIAVLEETGHISAVTRG